MLQSLRSHWPEYLMEAGELGAFMLLASGFATLLYAPTSPVPELIPNGLLRGVVMGSIMGICAIAIIYSPWGKQSGAHFNPAVTLAFYRLGKLEAWDALFYVIAQFIGGVAGVGLAVVLFGPAFTNQPVNYIVTVPGIWGWTGALATEALLAFGLMVMVLIVSNHTKLHHLTGVFAGILVAIFVTLAGPISGMSINPARTFASGLPAQVWTHFWIYYFAPPLAMLLAAELYLRLSQRRSQEICGKVCPNTETRCICTACPCMEDPQAT
ncbi:MAG: aquaporin family protein [Spirulina sp. SIO3F2]|nr:aquaporin family protein [Spirulina sp. SIO3F2]